MKNHQNNTSAPPALLRTASSVDTLETNSLCCAAAGIIAPSSATAEALIPHEKLRGAALADATLNAQERPPAQPAVGYSHVPSTLESPPDKLADSPLPAAARFVAARPFTGPGALMRRFGIGLQRARWLLVDLEQQGVVRGHWSRLVAAGHTRGGPVYSHRIYRVSPGAWSSIQGHSGPSRWVSGMEAELGKFAALDNLSAVQQHVWFIERLLIMATSLGLATGAAAELRRQLILEAIAARRRLVPGWREARKLFGAEFFGAVDADLAVMQ
ncbi:hypothetical protein [Pseudomonas cyclaminis]|uniref:hypothetical protein n=1 Tax=Pseudomonas cyclaminis TaxID=2781239 RepID=UPI00380503B6